MKNFAEEEAPQAVVAITGWFWLMMRFKNAIFALGIGLLASPALAYESHSCLVLNVHKFQPTPVTLSPEGRYHPRGGKVWVFSSLRGGTGDEVITHLWERNDIGVDRFSRKVTFNRGFYSLKALTVNKTGHWTVRVMDGHWAEERRIEFEVGQDSRGFYVKPSSAADTDCNPVGAPDALIGMAGKGFMGAIAEPAAVSTAQGVVGPSASPATAPPGAAGGAEPTVAGGKGSAPSEDKSASGWPSIDLIPFAGALIPVGALASHVKTAATYGLGIGKDAFTADSQSAYVSLSASHAQLPAKDSALRGSISLTPILAQVDYQCRYGDWQPYLGAGFGIFLWRAQATQTATQSSNSGSGESPGGLLAAGVAYRLLDRVALVPEAAIYRAWGTLQSTYETIDLALRVRL